MERMVEISRRPAFARLADWLGPWSIEPRALDWLVRWAERTDLVAHVASHQLDGAVREGTDVEVRALEGGGRGRGRGPRVAVVEARGVLMKSSPSMMAGTSTVELRRQLRVLRSDEGIDGVLLVIDSPGGTVAGTRELAEDVAALAAEKPVAAVVEDLCASAAYWAASQASRVFAEPSSAIGSIGTYAVVEDSHGAAEEAGVRVHVVSTGAHKGRGVPGTEVTEEDLSEVQRLVDGLNGHFQNAVRAGRGLDGDRLSAVSDGRVWLAEEAAGLGLVDEVGNFEAALGWVVSSIQQAREERRAMDAASVREIRAACPDAPTDWIVEQASAELPIGEVRENYQNWLRAERGRLEAERDEARAAAEEASRRAAAQRGLEPLVTGPSAGGEDAGESAREEVERLVAERMRVRHEPRHLAHYAVMQGNPGLRARLVDEANATAG